MQQNQTYKRNRLPLSQKWQECQELSGICVILPKSQENVRKIDEFLVMSGKCQEFCMMC